MSGVGSSAVSFLNSLLKNRVGDVCSRVHLAAHEGKIHLRAAVARNELGLFEAQNVSEETALDVDVVPHRLSPDASWISLRMN